MHQKTFTLCLPQIGSMFTKAMLPSAIKKLHDKVIDPQRVDSLTLNFVKTTDFTGLYLSWKTNSSWGFLVYDGTRNLIPVFTSRPVKILVKGGQHGRLAVTGALLLLSLRVHRQLNVKWQPGARAQSVKKKRYANIPPVFLLPPLPPRRRCSQE
jgi:hypothetical protein